MNLKRHKKGFIWNSGTYKNENKNFVFFGVPDFKFSILQEIYLKRLLR